MDFCQLYPEKEMKLFTEWAPFAKRVVKYAEKEINDNNVKQIIKSSGNYVVVLYDQKYYPGKVIKTIQPKNEFVVSTMEKSGIKDWIWPEEKDEVTYKRADIICLIKKPRKKMQRGTLPYLKWSTLKNLHYSSFFKYL